MKNNQRNKDLGHELQNVRHKLPEKSNCGDSLPTLFSEVRKKIVIIRRKKVIADADVAAIYGVETKRVNEAVHNNPEKFPERYMFVLTREEKDYLRSKISTTRVSEKSRTLPKVFTERGLYMLATILRGVRALD